MNATKTRQTAGNNVTLRAIRNRMNAAIYREVLARWNAEGEEPALDFLGRYFNAESWPRVKAELREAR